MVSMQYVLEKCGLKEVKISWVKKKNFNFFSFNCELYLKNWEEKVNMCNFMQ